VLDKINHTWRWFGTAFSFFVFGVVGLILTIFMVPLLNNLPGSKLVRERRARKTIHHIFRIYIDMMKILGVLTYQIDDIEKLEGARLILANHPSLLDVVFLISMVPDANCVVKGKLTDNFFIQGPIKAAGYINNEDASDVMAAASRVFESGQTLVMFPEGTRTTASEALQFKRGAANIAVRTGSDITPVLIYCTPTTLTKNERWYQVPCKRVHFHIQVKDQISIKPYVTDLRPSMGARYLTDDLTKFFIRELKSNG